mgnify:CR=1 FL=1
MLFRPSVDRLSIINLKAGSSLDRKSDFSGNLLAGCLEGLGSLSSMKAAAERRLLLATLGAIDRSHRATAPNQRRLPNGKSRWHGGSPDS